MPHILQVYVNMHVHINACVVSYYLITFSLHLICHRNHDCQLIRSILYCNIATVLKYKKPRLHLLKFTKYVILRNSVHCTTLCGAGATLKYFR